MNVDPIKFWEEADARAEPSEGRSDEDEAYLLELAALDPVAYDRRRLEAAKRLGIRCATLDDLVRARRPQDSETEDGKGRKLTLPEFVPWPEPVSGEAVLSELVAAFKRHLSLADGSAEIMTLWVLHTHTLDAWRITPRLAVLSPEKRCGKTTALETLSELVPRQLMASNISTAAVFRTIELARPTLIIDEADTFLEGNSELRGVLNSGHGRSGSVIRIVGDDHEPRAFSTWSPVAIAMIGSLPDTLQDRSIVIGMRRRHSEEQVEPLRGEGLNILHELGRKCARWTSDHIDQMESAEPTIPESLHDRAADNWFSLFAIADTVGGDWPMHIRSIAERAITRVIDESDSIGTDLLADIRDIIIKAAVESITSISVIERLNEMEDRPWLEFKNSKPLNQRQLAGLLKPFGIKSKTIRLGTTTAKGYTKQQFEDAFARYLPPPAVTP